MVVKRECSQGERKGSSHREERVREALILHEGVQLCAYRPRLPSRFRRYPAILHPTLSRRSCPVAPQYRLTPLGQRCSRGRVAHTR